MAQEPGGPQPVGTRAVGITTALRLSYVSIAWGTLSGATAVAVGIASYSLAVVGIGLNVVCDVVGSVMLVWRFRQERGDPEAGAGAEARAGIVIGIALAVVAVVLTVETIVALASKSRPDVTAISVAAAAVNLVVLVPLGLAKRRVGRALGSKALQGDAMLSLIGAGLALLALVGLVLNWALDWWWADRVAALVVACVAASESVRLLTRKDHQIVG